MLGLDFGQDVRMTVGEVTINTVAPLRTARIQHTPKPTATKVVVKLAQLEEGCYEPDGHFEVSVSLVERKVTREVEALPKCSVLAVEFPGLNSSGFAMARLAALEFRVRFNAE